ATARRRATSTDSAASILRSGFALVEGIGRVVRPAGEQLGRFGRALDVLRGDAADEIPGEILDQTDAGALRREARRGRRRYDHAAAGERAPEAGQIDMLDTARDLAFGGVADLELVEDIAGFPRVVVGVPQAGIVGARRGELLMPGLRTQRGGQAGEAQIHGRELHLHTGFLFLVGEDLPHAVAHRIGIILQPELVVLVVGHAVPEPDGIDEIGRPAPFTLAGQLDLVGVDARPVILAFDAGDVIERVILGNGETEKTVAEHIGAAERLSAIVKRRVWLFAVERARLRRPRRFCRIRWEEIRIARNAIVVCAASERVSMHRDIAGATIEQHGAFDPIIDALHGRARLDVETARYVRGGGNSFVDGGGRAGGGRSWTARQRLGNAVVGRADDAADRLRAVAQGRGAADHLDLIGREWIDRHEMILAK